MNILTPTAPTLRGLYGRSLELARVLLVDDELTSRLTMQTLLEAGGYSVDVAASIPEALTKLDEQQYELVLSNLKTGTQEAGLNVLAYARVKDYKPATALVTSYHDIGFSCDPSQEEERISIRTEDISSLLSKVAHLISLRATRQVERTLR